LTFQLISDVLPSVDCSFLTENEANELYLTEDAADELYVQQANAFDPACIYVGQPNPVDTNRTGAQFEASCINRFCPATLADCPNYSGKAIGCQCQSNDNAGNYRVALERQGMWRDDACECCFVNIQTIGDTDPAPPALNIQMICV
jgi:hypothetical protein